LAPVEGCRRTNGFGESPRWNRRFTYQSGMSPPSGAAGCCTPHQRFDRRLRSSAPGILQETGYPLNRIPTPRGTAPHWFWLAEKELRMARRGPGAPELATNELESICGAFPVEQGADPRTGVRTREAPRRRSQARPRPMLSNWPLIQRTRLSSTAHTWRRADQLWQLVCPGRVCNARERHGSD
jgi:hypothetical protein